MAVSGLCIQRLSNGQISATLSNMRGENIGMIGTFEGNAQVVIGNTTSGSGTAYYVLGDSSTEIGVTDASKNLSFWGSGLSVDVLDQDNESNIEWGASNGKLSFENTSRAAQLEIDSDAQDNVFTFGWGDAEIYDNGKYNVTQLGSGTSSFSSTASSIGSCVQGGSGNASYQIAGNYGVYVQGTGFATYQINSNANGQPGTYGDKNAIISNSQSAIVDNGSRSYIWQKSSGSTLTANGYRSIAEVADESQVTQGDDNDLSVVFAGGVTSKKENISGSEVTISLNKNLYEQGWSNTWENNDNYYMSTSGHNSHITGSWLNAGYGSTLFGRLTIGDSYADKVEE